MARAKTYRAAVAVVKVSVGPASGNRIARFVRRGGVIPEGVEQDLLDSLLSRGLIEAVQEDDVADDVDVEVFDGPPAKSAKRETWDAYARSLGLPDAAIAELKKPELIDTVTTPELLDAALAAAEENGEEDGDDEDEPGA